MSRDLQERIGYAMHMKPTLNWPGVVVKCESCGWVDSACGKADASEKLKSHYLMEHPCIGNRFRGSFIVPVEIN